jgi:hypothetical protein
LGLRVAQGPQKGEPHPESQQVLSALRRRIGGLATESEMEIVAQGRIVLEGSALRQVVEAFPK